jgi:peroxiredoxin
MSAIGLGQPAPSFRLPAATGGHVSLDDFRGRNPVIVWFTKGMACPFCRQQMSQLARGASRFRALEAEVLQVTPTPSDRARFYAKQFTLPFPYLSDPEYRVRREWGLDVRPHSLLWKAKRMLNGMRATPPPSDFGNVKFGLAEVPSLVTDEDSGIFILDRDGVVRFVSSGPYATTEGPRGMPSTDEIARVLEQSRAAGA